MEQLKYQAVGCAIVATFLLSVILGGLYFAERTTAHLVDYAGQRASVERTQIVTTGKVDVARIGAQKDITIGCMQYSYVTPSLACMLLGGVNGFSWARWGLLGVALICGLILYKGR